jgi:hypothetical protein
VDSGRVNQNNLPFRLVDDALDLEARRLWFVGDGGNLLPDELIQKRRLTGIRPANESHVAAAVTFVLWRVCQDMYESN